MTRIAPFHGLLISGPSGASTGRARGSIGRSARVDAAAARSASGFVPLELTDALGRPPLSPHPRSARSSALAIFGLTAVAAAAAATAAAVTWRGAAGRIGAAGVGPAGLHLHRTSARPPEVGEPVSVLIAVRHDPEPTLAAVRAALDQRGVDHLDIVVLDDGCPQQTRTALRQEFGDDPRVRILAAAPLPRGWSPRAHRSHQLAVAARGKVLIFAEPNAPLGPHAVASVTALLRGEQLDLAVLDTGRPATASTSTGSSAGTGVDASADVGTNSIMGSVAAGKRAESRAARESGLRPRAAQSEEGGKHSGQSSDGHAIGEGSEVGRSQDRASQDTEWATTRSRDRRSQSGHAGVTRSRDDKPNGTRGHGGRQHGNRFHPGRFAVAVDADTYWRTGGYRAVAGDADPLALLRTVRRANGRVAVADGRRVIPPAQLIVPMPPADLHAEAEWDSVHGSRLSIGETARRVFSALVGGRP